MLSNHLSTSAAPDLRDRFLNALDACDHVSAVELARRLTSCSDQLPSQTCMALGLPPGSRYAAAADRVLSRASIKLKPDVNLASLARMAMGRTDVF